MRSTGASGELTLSVVIPVRDQRYLIAELVRRVEAFSMPGARLLEILVVDDGSTDGTAEVLASLEAESDRVRVLSHGAVRGRGAALRTGIAAAAGDVILFQSGELDSDPRDDRRLIQPFLDDGADAVYGSRFLAGGRRRVLDFQHTTAHRRLSRLSNRFTHLDMTDVATRLKAFRAALLKSIPLRSADDRIELELAAKIAKRQLRLFEVPVSYLGGRGAERSTPGRKHLLLSFATILRYWLEDDIYAEDEYGSHILTSLERTRRFNRWMASTVAHHVGQGARVLEIGAGIGNITQWLLPREHYLASDVNPNYLHYLQSYALGRPYLEVARIDLEEAASFEPWRGRFDTVVCLNVLEHVRDPLEALRHMRSALAPGGRVVLYVPQGGWLYSTLDEVLGHRCRYDRASLARELAGAGLELERMEEFNRASVPGWWWNGKVLKRRRFSRVQLKIFDSLIPIIRRVDRVWPWPGLGLFAVAQRPAGE